MELPSFEFGTVHSKNQAARLQIHANFHENFENVFEMIYCGEKKGSNLHIINGTYKHENYQKVVKICIKSIYCISRKIVVNTENQSLITRNNM
jgi:hypothetical protein